MAPPPSSSTTRRKDRLQRVQAAAASQQQQRRARRQAAAAAAAATSRNNDGGGGGTTSSGGGGSGSSSAPPSQQQQQQAQQRSSSSSSSAAATSSAPVPTEMEMESLQQPSSSSSSSSSAVSGSTRQRKEQQPEREQRQQQQPPPPPPPPPPPRSLADVPLPPPPSMTNEAPSTSSNVGPPPPPPSTASSSSSSLAAAAAAAATTTTTTGGAGGSGGGGVLVSVESPLPPVVQRCLGDRSYDKRKNAALEIEALVKSLQEASNVVLIHSVIAVLSKDFCTSMNANYRKGGLIGIAATAIGLSSAHARQHLDALLPPVLHCFDDPESRVRYYACESLYNIAKVTRSSVLRHFNVMFDGLAKLFADVDPDVKNGANLLDRLIKDIVTESESFQVDQFLPSLQNYIRRTNPYIRQLLVGWITVLDSVPDINMLDHLPDFLDGLFNMLSDSNREIRQAADSALSEFLREVRQSPVVEFGPLVSILVSQCHAKERLNRLTAVTWLSELIHHPKNGNGDALLPYHADVLGAVLRCSRDAEREIRHVADKTDSELLSVVRDRVTSPFELSPLLDATKRELTGIDKDVNTKMASLRWIDMLLEKRPGDMAHHAKELLPVLLGTLRDSSDAVVLLTLQVLSRISLTDHDDENDENENVPGEEMGEDVPGGGTASPKRKGRSAAGVGAVAGGGSGRSSRHFRMVLHAILGLFASDRRLLETRGSLVVRKLCVLLNAESVYIRMADALVSRGERRLRRRRSKAALDADASGAGMMGDDALPSSPLDPRDGDDDNDDDHFTLEFVATMVQTLNLILLTAAELHGLRVILAESFVDDGSLNDYHDRAGGDGGGLSRLQSSETGGSRGGDGAAVFASLFRCWCHSPVSTFSLCLLARAYDVAFDLVRRFSELEVTVGFLMQIDKLVQLLESPVFVHLRLRLLDVEDPRHAPLLKSCYGLLMLLPQSDAFRSLNDRLATVCNLRDNLGIGPGAGPPLSLENDRGVGLGGDEKAEVDENDTTVGRAGLDAGLLLARFDEVMELHRRAAREGMLPRAAALVERDAGGSVAPSGAGAKYSHSGVVGGAGGSFAFGHPSQGGIGGGSSASASYGMAARGGMEGSGVYTSLRSDASVGSRGSGLTGSRSLPGGRAGSHVGPLDVRGNRSGRP